MKHLPKNDSQRFRFRVRLADGSLLSLNGFAISITVRDSTGAQVFTGAGTVLSPDTMATAFIPRDTLAALGVYDVAVRAVNASSQEAYTAKAQVQVEDHA